MNALRGLEQFICFQCSPKIIFLLDMKLTDRTKQTYVALLRAAKPPPPFTVPNVVPPSRFRKEDENWLIDGLILNETATKADLQLQPSYSEGGRHLIVNADVLRSVFMLLRANILSISDAVRKVKQLRSQPGKS